MFKFASPALLFTLLLTLNSAQAGSLWGDGGFSAFTESLPRADVKRVEQTLGREWANVIYRSGLEPNRVHKADFAHIDAVLERSVQAKLGILELFTSIELADPKAPALLLDEDLLQRIDAKYDLSSVWMLSAKPKGGKAGALKMRYMIVGQGILVMGYPHPATVEILDDGKFFEYEYESVISAKIVNNAKTRGLFSVRTLASPNEEFNDFKGPMGVSIRGYEVKGSRIRVEYHLVVDQETEVAKKPIIIRSDQGVSSP
jgi:hypothetical protein